MILACRTEEDTPVGDRHKKEEAMHERFVVRLEADLEMLRKSAESGRLVDPSLARERLGRLKKRNWRATGVFDFQARPVLALSPRPIAYYSSGTDDDRHQ